MRLTQPQFRQIFDQYLKQKNIYSDSRKTQYAFAFKEVILFAEQHIPEDLLNLAALSVPGSEQTEQFKLFCEFLEASLLVAKDGSQVTFYKEVALAAKATVLDPKLSVLNSTHIDDAPSSLSIREKYSRGLLTAQHWATDLDLQRMLELTNTQSTIKIMPFTAQSLGAALHFAREAKKDSSAPYTLPFLLNLGREGNSQGNHYIAVKITVNPLKPSVSYEIDDSFKLSEQQKATYKKEIENALKFDDGIHKAYPEATIESGTIKGAPVQKDDYASGYRALHSLLQDPSISRDNPIAQDFAKVVPSESTQLIRSFYRHQLEDFALPMAAFDVLSSKARSGFKKPNATEPKFVRVEKTELDKFLQVLPLEVSLSEGTQLHIEVQKCIGTYSPQLPRMRFPEGLKVKALDAIQYENLFQNLSQNQQLIASPLPDFVLTRCDSEALDGLNAFFAEQSVTLFKKLTVNIDLDKASDADLFITKFKFSLNNLSRANLSHLVIIDEKGVLTEQHIKDIIEFVSKKQISIVIDLPKPYKSTNYQQQLDLLTGINCREKNSKLFGEQLFKEASKGQVNKPKSKRTRERVNLREAMKIDIELQEGVDETVVVEKQQKKRSSGTDYGKPRVFRMDDLAEAASKEGNFSVFAKVSSSLSKRELIRYWHKLLGNITPDIPIRFDKSFKKDWVGGQQVITNNELNGISDRALEYLIEHKKYFEAGINIRQLPQGFLIIEDPENPGKRILHYDKNLDYHATIALKPLALRLKPIISIDLADKLMSHEKPDKFYVALWNKLNTGNEYSRTESDIFRRNLPDLMLLSDPQLKTVLELCGGEAAFDYNKFNFIFEKMVQAKDLYAEPYNEADLISVAGLESLFPKQDDRKKYINLAYEINPKPGTSHLLFSILDDEDLKKLTAEIKTYELTDVQLNGLLAIYDKYGSSGIEKILKTWKQINANHNISLKQLRSIQEYVDGYEGMVLSDDVRDAAVKISGFTTEQRQWWNQLYAAHNPVDDYLPNLVSSFTDFSKAISDMGLSFYEVNSFKNTRNLPTTLGRILSILNLCKEKDRQVQWRAISAINLSGEGAIRAMTSGLDKNGVPCGFVLPEMHVSAELYKSNSSENLSARKTIGVKVASTRFTLFYSNLASQKYRMSLSFYQEAVKSLEEARADKTLPEEAVNNLYSILAEVTTGDNYRYFIKDEETGKAQWAAIVNNIKKINLPTASVTTNVKAVTVEQLTELDHLPALPLLGKVVEVLTKPLHNVGLSDIYSLKTKIGPRLQANNTKLKAFTRHYKNKIFLGMKFYTDSDFTKEYPEKRDLLEEHMKVGMLLSDELVANELLPLISTFRIGSENFAELFQSLKAITELKDDADRFVSAFNRFQIDYAMELLGDIEQNGDLSVKDLNEVIGNLTDLFKSNRGDFDSKINKLKTEIDELDRIRKSGGIVDEQFQSNYEKLITEYKDLLAIIECLKEPIPLEGELANIFASFYKSNIQNVIAAQFQKNFPKDYFENLKAGKPKAQIQLEIDKLFKETALREVVNTIRTKFSGAADEQQMQMIGSLAALCENLSSSEKDELFAKLKDARLLGASIEHYNKLLLSIEKHGSSSFVYFMQAADQLSTPIEDLALKVDFFLSKALPDIRKNPNVLLNELDMVEIVAELVLAGRKDEINKEINIDPLSTNVYVDLQNVLSSKNWDQIILELGKFPVLDLIELIELKEHLEWFTTKEFTGSTRIDTIVTEEPITGAMHAMRKFFNKNTPDTVKVTKTITVPIQVPVIKSLNQSLITAATDLLTGKVSQLKSYDYALALSLSIIEGMVAKYPAAKLLILAFTRNYLSFGGGDRTQIEDVFANLRLIQKELVALNDQDTVISICNHFGQEKSKEDTFSYKDFLAIVKGEKVKAVDFANFPKLEQQAKCRVLKVISSLLNNDKPCSPEDIQSLINGCSDRATGKIYAEVLEQLFQCAPFPTLDLIEQWFSDAKDSADVKKSVFAEYTAWTKNPVTREPDKNGFNVAYAKKQRNQMQGIDYSDTELQAIDTAVKRVRDLTTQELLNEIRTIKPTDFDQLTALMAELLYRTKGLPQIGIGEGREYGRSFEINTTQYLAIHSMLKAGGRVTSEIGTGEGKSRIMMISIACQFALGKTVDFVTSDLSLATRDYLEYQAFFKALGAETNIIYAQTPANEYRLKGINFSDASNLSLFRNKARSEGQEDLVLAKDTTQRSLMLDEADKTYFDMSETRFNYSAQADASIRDIPFIYELMVEFFSDAKNVDEYYNDPDKCNEHFFSFARSKLTETQMARLVFNPKIPMPVITQNQLEAWQSSALTALELEVNKDFTIKPDVTIQTKDGPKVVSQAQLMSGGGRASGNAKFSFGVHQCLHARLNLLRKNGTADEELARELKGIKSSFYIDSENQIVYSSTSKALIDDYSAGSLLAVTGTKGSIEEVEEAAELFAKACGQKMTFIDVPRHHDLQRADLPVAVAKDSKQHLEKILASVKESLAKTPPQPVLLICENDTKSKELYDFLDSKLSTEEKKALVRISAKTPLSEEADHVNNKAGQSGAITVSTAMLGRGTDIKLHKVPKIVNGKETKEKVTSGLSVIGTYLPRERDYKQIIGRAGRFGALGQSRLILDKGEVKQQMGVKVLPTEFYTATEAYISRMQKNMDLDKQKQRVVKNSVGDFRLELTKQFFNEFYNPLIKENSKETLLEAWQVFFDKTDKSWNEQWPKIANELAQSPCKADAVNKLMGEYYTLVAEEWKAMGQLLQAQINAKKIKSSSPEEFVDSSLKLKAQELKLTPKAEKIVQSGSSILEKGELKTIVAKKYDSAFVGRAVIYSDFTDGFKAFVNNFKAAWRGDGPWFPNYKAARNGNLSWSEFFLGTWATPKSSSTNEGPISDQPVKMSTAGMLTGFGATLQKHGEKNTEGVKEVDEKRSGKKIKEMHREHPREELGVGLNEKLVRGKQASESEVVEDQGLQP
jgi:hypothetical protein